MVAGVCWFRVFLLFQRRRVQDGIFPRISRERLEFTLGNLLSMNGDTVDHSLHAYFNTCGRVSSSPVVGEGGCFVNHLEYRWVHQASNVCASTRDVQYTFR